MNKLLVLEKEVSTLRREVRQLRDMFGVSAAPDENAVDVLYLRRIAEAYARGDKGPLKEHNRRKKAEMRGLDSREGGNDKSMRGA